MERLSSVPASRERRNGQNRGFRAIISHYEYRSGTEADLDKSAGAARKHAHRALRPLRGPVFGRSATWPELTGEPAECAKFDVRIVSPIPGTFTCAIGTPIAPHASLDETPCTDIVIVTDLAFAVDADPRSRWPAAAEWVRERFSGGATVCSVCTGSVLLADTGLLDGEEATTHWIASGLFRTYYPAVKLRPERILAPAGPEHRIVTSGGASSWEDLALYLIARFRGEAEAVRTAKLFLFGDRSEGQMPYAAMARPRRHDDAVIVPCQDWIAEHYAADNPVAGMVARSGLPARTFKRRFRAATGYAPLDYVQTLRIRKPSSFWKPPASRPTPWRIRSAMRTSPSFAAFSSDELA